eukprot:COSAG01_NODE_4791_length_4740_cov_9.356820_6_plen_73_part_00
MAWLEATALPVGVPRLTKAGTGALSSQRRCTMLRRRCGISYDRGSGRPSPPRSTPGCLCMSWHRRVLTWGCR